jgi:diazepam-binding inhibitor (GABA receptor modulating acyl-CoA-binding protein)
MNKEEQIKVDFEKACSDIKNVSGLDNDTMLNLYGLYKQALEGDCNTDKPSFFDPRGQAKWSAWNENKGMDSTIAMRRYTRKVKSILG